MKKTFFKKGLVALCVAALLCTFASCGENKENSSEAASEATSVESTVDTSAEASEEASEEASAEVSEEASAEASAEVSEEAPVEIPEEYKDNKGIAAIVEMEKEVESMGKGKLVMNGRFDFDANLLTEMWGEKAESFINLNGICYAELKVEFYFDNTGDEEKTFKRVTTEMHAEAAGQVIADDKTINESLTIGNVEYVFDHEAKTYTTEEEDEDTATDFENIKSVETKEEVYEGTTYVVDTITFADDTVMSIYTVDGVIAYFGTEMPGSSENVSLKLAVEIDHDVSGVSFEIPEGYTAA